jgi:putative alpha-1,2-mannosidase
MSPTLYSEVGGVYVGMDKAVHNSTMERVAKGYTVNEENKLSLGFFSDLSLWDTFRAMLPWQLLTRQDVSIGILRSMEEITIQQDAFPRWPLASTESGCMIGMHGAATVLEGLKKGYKDYFNVKEIQLAMLDQATNPSSKNGRGDVEFYIANGYVSEESSDVAASLTLSYAYDDSLLAEVSSYVGDMQSAKEAKARSYNYQNIWSRSHELMCPRTSAGELHCPISAIGPQAWNMYKEGDALHWLWFVPHDIEGLMHLFKSDQDFLLSLEAFFEDHVASHEKVGSFLPNPYFW